MSPPAEAARSQVRIRPAMPERLRARIRRQRDKLLFNRELRLRLLSAAALIPLVLVATWLGEVPFAVVVLVTGVLVVTEWLRMVGAGPTRGLRVIAFGALAAVAAMAVAAPTGVTALGLVAAVAVVAASGWATRCGARARWIALGMLYAGGAVVALIELRKGADGFVAVLFVLLIAWTTDTAAFFVGRKLGGPKLWPRVSPSKTWSGAIGGLLGGGVTGVLVALSFDAPSLAVAFAVAVAVAVAAEAGDLLESAAKRRFRVKDAGTLIPGHGGVMDRVDGLIVAAIVTVGLGVAAGGDTAAAGLVGLLSR